MLSLPVVFLCNTIAFMVLMEERFKVITTLAVSGAVFLFSLVTGAITNSLFTDPTLAGELGVILSVLWALLASVFIASNSIVQKIFVALVLILNYLFVSDFIPYFLGALPFGTAGILAVLISNGIFILFSLLVICLQLRPMHYFYRRGVSLSWVFQCAALLGGILISMGAANTFFHTQSFAFRFFLEVIVYIWVLVVMRSVYSGAHYKVKEMNAQAEGRVKESRIQSYEMMVSNVEAFRNAKNNVEYAFKRIGALADAGKTKEISTYVNLAIEKNKNAPLLEYYCEDPYVNAVVATRAAQAEEQNIVFQCNISLGGLKLKISEMCAIIDELLLAAMSDCSKAEEEKFIRFNVLPAEDKVTIEAIHTVPQKAEVPVRSRTVFDFVKEFFEETDDESESLIQVKEIIEKHSGSINISHTQDEKIIRVGVNY